MAQELRKMPIRSREITLSGDYEGWNFTARTNIPLGALEEMTSGAYPELRAALVNVVLDWNFVDEAGRELPRPAEIRQRTFTDEEDKPLGADEMEARRNEELQKVMKRIPIDLAVAMSRALNRAIWELPPN